MAIVYCTNKLKSFLKPLVSDTPLLSQDGWNAHLFYIKARKCIAFIHKETLYVVVLFDVFKKDLSKIRTLFRQAFINQLSSDEILKKREAEEWIEKYVEQIYFQSTDNDRSVLGSLNDTIARITCWNTPNMLEEARLYVAKHTNRTPMGAVNYQYPKELMKQKINQEVNVL